MYEDCFLRRLYRLLGAKYSLSLLHAFSPEPVTFNQLSALSNNINPTLLSERIKEFVDLGIVTKASCANHTSYVLAPDGAALKGHLSAIKGWSVSQGKPLPAVCRQQASVCTCQFMRKGAGPLRPE